jgi:hypothetical protein
MKGAVSYADVMDMTLTEKQIMADFISKQVAAENKVPKLPGFKRGGK